MVGSGRDKNATKGGASLAPKPSRNDPHQHIPKDANGVPIFLILSDGTRASYERRMAACEAAWLATGDPLVIDEAQTWTFTHRQPIPSWLHEAVGQLAHGRRTKTHAKRAIERAVKFMRYQAVRDAHWPDGRSRPKKLSWPKSYERASEVLKGSSAAGEPSTMEDDYKEVIADLKNGRGGLYHVIKTRRRKPAPTTLEIARRTIVRLLNSKSKGR